MSDGKTAHNQDVNDIDSYLQQLSSVISSLIKSSSEQGYKKGVQAASKSGASNGASEGLIFKSGYEAGYNAAVEISKRARPTQKMSLRTELTLLKVHRVLTSFVKQGYRIDEGNANAEDVLLELSGILDVDEKIDVDERILEIRSRLFNGKES